MATMKIVCNCGSQMETEGSVIHCGIEADRFFKAHEACRNGHNPKGDQMETSGRYLPSDRELRTATKQEMEINKRFTYHPPIAELNQAERYEDIRESARLFALGLTNQCPESRELSLAITKLEEVVFWANAAIARNESNAQM